MVDDQWSCFIGYVSYAEGIEPGAESLHIWCAVADHLAAGKGDNKECRYKMHKQRVLLPDTQSREKFRYTWWMVFVGIKVG